MKVVAHDGGRFDLFLRGGYNQKRLTADDLAAAETMMSQARAAAAPAPTPPAPTTPATDPTAE